MFLGEEHKFSDGKHMFLHLKHKIERESERNSSV